MRLLPDLPTVITGQDLPSRGDGEPQPGTQAGRTAGVPGPARLERPRGPGRPQQWQEERTVAEHYDVIIIGTGAGGGTLAHTLAGSGKRVLLLERGDFLPRETQNWDPRAVFVDGRYISKDTWFDAGGKPFQPQVHYFVGGATKMYGAALYRLRPGDFGELRHVDGISPA